MWYLRRKNCQDFLICRFGGVSHYRSFPDYDDFYSSENEAREAINALRMSDSLYPFEVVGKLKE